DELFAIADEVERELSVGLLPGAPTSASDVLRRGAAALGWEHSEIPRWMVYPASGDATKGVRQSMTRTYLPRAARAGARLVVGCRVDHLVRHGDTMLAARATFTDGRRSLIRCRDVFVCGGAIQSPALLQRSGIHGHIGKTLAVHPTVKLAARFADHVNVPDDVPVEQVKEFAPDLSFGGSASQPGLIALALSDHWSAFAGALRDWERISVYYAAITSEGRGTVRSLPRLRDPIVTYRLTHRDRELLRSGLARLALLMLEAGADEVYPSFRDAPLVRNKADIAKLQAGFAAAKASVMTVHLCSTVPLGEAPGTTAANSFGLVHGTTNVWVNDASLLPTAPGVNPQATVMAIAIRNARRFAAERRPHG
ncbi:MAG: GMC oxidoreductase, partial [Ilumatobacteraceae bacterium]